MIAIICIIIHGSYNIIYSIIYYRVREIKIIIELRKGAAKADTGMK